MKTNTLYISLTARYILPLPHAHRDLAGTLMSNSIFSRGSNKPSLGVFTASAPKIRLSRVPGTRFSPAWAKINTGGPRTNPARSGAAGRGVLARKLGGLTESTARASSSPKRLGFPRRQGCRQSALPLIPLSRAARHGRAGAATPPLLPRVHTAWAI